MGWKWVCESRIPREERRGPLNTSVSRKTARSDDISQVNLIVGWNELARSAKMETSSIDLRKNAANNVNSFLLRNVSVERTNVQCS